MLLKLKKYNYISMAFLFLIGPSLQVSAEDNKHDTKQDKFDFTELLCWDVMLLEEQERALALTLVYGYQAGVAANKIHTGEKIEKTLTSTRQLCEKNPDMKILAAVKKASL